MPQLEPSDSEWRVPFCPDCGQAGTHANTCSCFPREPVIHGNFEYVVRSAERDRYREALSEAIDFAEEGWSYAGDYFLEKWDFAARCQRLRDWTAAR